MFNANPTEADMDPMDPMEMASNDRHAEDSQGVSCQVMAEAWSKLPCELLCDLLTKKLQASSLQILLFRVNEINTNCQSSCL